MLKQSKGWIARAVLIVVTTLPVCVLAQDTTVRDTESDDRRRKSRNNGRVLRDSDGIPHIAARTEREVIYLQGFTHAQDLFQMDVTRRQAEGTLAELLGAGALASDVQLRTFGLRRAAERSLPILSQNVRNALSAYADGVNDYVARNSLPRIRGARDHDVSPVGTGRFAGVLQLIGFGLSFELTDLDRTTLLAQYQAAGAARGFDGAALFFEDVSRLAPFDNAATLARDYLANLGSLPFVQAALRNPDDERGSNEFVISGQHSSWPTIRIWSSPHRRSSRLFRERVPDSQCVVSDNSSDAFARSRRGSVTDAARGVVWMAR